MLKCLYCKNWFFNLRLKNGPVCRINGLPIYEARETCPLEKMSKSKKPIKTKPWPGAHKGYGAITRVY